MENANPVSSFISKQDQSSNNNDEFESLLKQLTEKELELSTLEKELSTFEGSYARTVGFLFAELDEIESEIAKELFRINAKEEYMHGFQRAESKARASREAVDEKITHAEKNLLHLLKN
jgi:hypothetical protein